MKKQKLFKTAKELKTDLIRELTGRESMARELLKAKFRHFPNGKKDIEASKHQVWMYQAAIKAVRAYKIK